MLLYGFLPCCSPFKSALVKNAFKKSLIAKRREVSGKHGAYLLKFCIAKLIRRFLHTNGMSPD